MRVTYALENRLKFSCQKELALFLNIVGLREIDVDNKKEIFS